MATTTPFNATNAYALWLMDGTVGTAAKQDNAEGTAARDLVEVGTLTSGTGQTTPTSNGTYGNFATGRYLTVTNANLLTWPTGAQTWEMWVYFNNIPTGGGAAFPFSKNGATAGPYIAVIDDGTIGGRLYTGSGTYDFGFAGTAVTASAWHYIAVVYEPSTRVDIYLDGVRINHNTSSIPAAVVNANGIDLGIGTQVSQQSSAVDGYIDAFKISTVALTDNDISTYYAGAVGPTNVKTWDGVTQSTGIKTYEGVALANVKSVNGIT